MPADPHGWASWQEYLNAHQGKLGSYDFFLLEDQLRPVITEGRVLWKGVLLCADGIEIRVDRTQTTRRRHGTLQVMTRDYGYQVVQRAGSATRQILRYDNVGTHGHLDPHHRHVYDESGEETIEWVGRAGWPNLGQILDEVHDCWQRWKAGETNKIVALLKR